VTHDPRKRQAPPDETRKIVASARERISFDDCGNAAYPAEMPVLP
jgi:hypothetical protein